LAPGPLRNAVCQRPAGVNFESHPPGPPLRKGRSKTKICFVGVRPAAGGVGLLFGSAGHTRRTRNSGATGARSTRVGFDVSEAVPKIPGVRDVRAGRDRRFPSSDSRHCHKGSCTSRPDESWLFVPGGIARVRPVPVGVVRIAFFAWYGYTWGLRPRRPRDERTLGRRDGRFYVRRHVAGHGRHRIRTRRTKAIRTTPTGTGRTRAIHRQRTTSSRPTGRTTTFMTMPGI